MTEHLDRDQKVWDRAQALVGKIIPLDQYPTEVSESAIDAKRVAIAASLILTATVAAAIVAYRKLHSRKNDQERD